MILVKFLISLVFLITQFTALQADDYVISNIIQLDPIFSKHVLVAEKSKFKLHVYKLLGGGGVERIKTFKMAYGKFPGDKRKQGDKKTPEGIYSLGGFYDSNELIRQYGNYGKIYGIGAFTTNYPNLYDLYQGKTGDGIWIHSTDDESRIDKGMDSRGCVVLNDKNLKELSKYIDIKSNTPYISTHNLNYYDVETMSKLKKNILTLINDWANAWENQKIDKYISFYSDEFKTRSKMNLKGFKNNKRQIFRNTKTAKVIISNESILKHKDYIRVKFKQNYKSNLVSDIGIKTIYLKKNSSHQWKILREHWEKFDESKFLITKNSPKYFK